MLRTNIWWREWTEPDLHVDSTRRDLGYRSTQLGDAVYLILPALESVGRARPIQAFYFYLFRDSILYNYDLGVSSTYKPTQSYDQVSTVLHQISVVRGAKSTELSRTRSAQSDGSSRPNKI